MRNSFTTEGTEAQRLQSGEAPPGFGRRFCFWGRNRTGAYDEQSTLRSLSTRPAAPNDGAKEKSPGRFARDDKQTQIKKT